ncbi:putative fumarylacetoacetate hydrolase [Periconia macrospinosa]|uniref:Fumarylacetoacetase n=1 Tax=Periconia macrospinosa TaxID=97972 RepID=A0A2V1E0V5_9PLEO|nr:putative fumarylacetoacetate hydrolase [Periconia macrospinosa]
MAKFKFPIPVGEESPFPVENIPFGVFSTSSSSGPRGCTAIGDYVLDLAALEKSSLLERIIDGGNLAFSKPHLNTFAALPDSTRSRTRTQIAELLADSSSTLWKNETLVDAAFHLQADVQMHLPIDVTDPIAYNGRVSSIVLSKTDFRRPHGVSKGDDDVPRHQPSRKLDYELEIGMIISKDVPFGDLLRPDEVDDGHIFGFVLINDWSARDFQGYESNPVGPFNSKSFVASVSPWVIVPEALALARASPLHQKENDVQPYLRHASLKDTIFDVDTDAYITRAGADKQKVSTSNLKHSYFSLAQMIMHRASSGCGLRKCELIGTGTISSPDSEYPDNSVGHTGCLWELALNETREVPNAGGGFLNDGDTITFNAWATGKNGRRISFGNLTATVLPAL